ncbi:MAG: hypothetical protein KAS40_01895, partial [Desulfobacterales bacterium]|nr:hypothetical protein [Desulfobacterales bacterium]
FFDNHYIRASANFLGCLFVKHLKSCHLHDDPSGLPYAPNLIIGSDSDIRRGNSQKGVATDGYKI